MCSLNTMIRAVLSTHGPQPRDPRNERAPSQPRPPKPSQPRGDGCNRAAAKTSSKLRTNESMSQMAPRRMESPVSIPFEKWTVFPMDDSGTYKEVYRVKCVMACVDPHKGLSEGTRHRKARRKSTGRLLRFVIVTASLEPMFILQKDLDRHRLLQVIDERSPQALRDICAALWARIVAIPFVSDVEAF